MALEELRAGFGTAQFVAPQQTSALLRVGHLDRRAEILCQVLGARLIIQGALTDRHGSRMHRAGAAVDFMHAASMVAVAMRSSQYRRACLMSALTSVALGTAELVVAARVPR